IGAGLLAYVPPQGKELSPFRLVLGTACFGLALAGNAKTVFLLAPLVAYAWAARVSLPERLRRWVPAALAVAAIPLVPAVYLARMAPALGFTGEVSRRLSIAGHKVLTVAWLHEPSNLLQYWSDVAAYGDVIRGLSLRDQWSWILPALSL